MDCYQHGVDRHHTQHRKYLRENDMLAQKLIYGYEDVDTFDIWLIYLLVFKEFRILNGYIIFLQDVCIKQNI